MVRITTLLFIFILSMMNTALPTYQYTLTSIETILYSGFQPKLLQSVIDVINKLNAELVVPEEVVVSQPPVAPTKRDVVGERERRKHISNGKRDHGKNRGKHSHHNEVSAEEWDAMMAASSIVKKDAEGLEKDLTQIRILMNKISTKNYDTQKIALNDAIEKYIQDANASEEDMAKLFKSMIDIVGTNKFFSELYANLFKDWFQAFPVFRTMWDKQLDTFMHSIDEIRAVDPNVDYDGYCNYTKINDKRKAYTTFVGNLCVKDAIREDSVCGLLAYYLQKTLEYIDEKGRTAEVEEITENVFILITLTHAKLQENELWKESISNILINISQMKMKEHASLSNRAVFKYMDIVEMIE